MSDKRMFRVLLPYACYGVEVENGMITSAAPIARWAIGKSLSAFTAWLGRRGGTILLLQGQDDG